MARHRSATRWAVGVGLVLGMFLSVLWLANVGTLGGESLEPSNPGGPSEAMVIVLMCAPQVVAVGFLATRTLRHRPLGIGTGVAVGALLATVAWAAPGLAS